MVKKLSVIVCLSRFQILKEVHLQILKKTWTSFLLITFFKYSTKYTYKSSENLAQFLAAQLFQILKKVYLQVLKKTWCNF